MKPQYIIVHHSGGTDANPLQDSSNYTLAQCNADHKARFGMLSSLGSYVGYTYFIDKAGKVTQTRLDTEEGAHTIGYNSKSIGICMAGNFDATLPTEAQKASLKKLITEKMAQYSIPLANVVPHRKFASKTCFGRKLSDAWAQELVKGSVPPTPAKKPVPAPVYENGQVKNWYQRWMAILFNDGLTK